MKRLLKMKFLFLIFLLFLLSCSDTISNTPKGKLGEECYSDKTCDNNLVCEDNKCTKQQEDKCKYITCLNHGTCIIKNNKATCKCYDGYTPDGDFRCISNCTPNTCEDLNVECGAVDNGCGETLNCGGCDNGKLCNTTLGKCVDTCTPNCSNKECGDDGCGGTCGTCSNDKTCSNFTCISNCTPNTCESLNVECGAVDNGCGGTLNCGGCEINEICENNNCICNEDSHYENGNCILNGLCYNVTCGNNETCDDNTGECVCSEGYRLKNNECSDNTVIDGITTSIITTPTVMISPSVFLRYAYRIIFNRNYDIAGFKQWKRQLELNLNTKPEVYEAFLGSDEFTSSETLKNKRNMITRVYQLLFNRIPASSEIDYWADRIKNYDGTGTGYTWYEFYHILTESQEYYSSNCDTNYYSYGKKLNNNTPLLQDLFTGRASFQPINQSVTVNISVKDNNGYNMMWDIGLSVIYDKNTNKYYAYNRVYNQSTGKFNIITSTSSDGIHFTQYEDLIFENSQNVLTLYDPHVVPDYLTCPKRYTMTFECNNVDGVGGANLCMSYTTTPDKIETWSYPENIIKGYNMNGENKSASTGVSLATTQNRYLSWTVVDDSSTGEDEGNESTYTKGMDISNSYYDFSDYSTTGTILLSAEANINCTGEECNNKDQTDWILEDNMYYILYNGANYYRCIRPGHANLNDGSSDWHIKIRRSSNAITHDPIPAYNIMDAERADICGISYGKINEFNGELYLYVSYYPISGGNKIIRSKLIWK